jgi:hypothetical protein
LQQGIYPKIFQERLGHADLRMTLNTYSHVIPNMQADAAEKLDELFASVDVSDEIKRLSETRRNYLPFGRLE